MKEMINEISKIIDAKKEFTFNELEKMCKSEKINEWLNKLFEGQSEIKQSKLNNMSTNKNLINLFEVYLVINDISIIDDDKEINMDQTVIDSLSLYLKSISQIPLLSREEEIELAAMVAQGDEGAKEKFITSNLRLVVSIAKKYVGTGISFDDLIQDGNIGLMKALEKFDASKGYKFSTYATWWIKQEITRSISEKSRIIRVPVYAIQLLNKYEMTKAQMKRTGYATDEDIAKELGISLKKLKKILLRIQEITSLNTIIDEEDGTTLENFIPSEINVEQTAIMNTEFKRDIQELLSQMTERERDIIELRFGFNNSKPHTLEEVSKTYGITRERIRQIEKKTLNKVKKKYPYLKEYL